MPLIVKDRVKETTTTTGTGTITLAGAVSGYQSFSVIGNGNTTYYAIVDSASGAWEVGIGTYTSSGTTLSRDTVLESSNSGNKVDFSAGSKDVFVTYPAERSVYTDETNATANIPSVTLGAGAVGTPSLTTSGDTNTGIFFPSADTIAFTEGGVEAMRLNSAGNVGIGVIPNSGWSSFTALQLGASTVITGRSSAILAADLFCNAYFDGSGWRALNTGGATRFNSNATDGFSFSTAASASAGNALTFTERMRIDSSGNVGIGTSSPTSRLHVEGTTLIQHKYTGASGPILFGQYDATGNASINNQANGALLFGTNNAERMRIDSSGNVGIGTSSPATKLDVIGTVQAIAAATQDAVRLAGRAGGTSSYAVTITPTTLTASRTLTLPDASTTIVGTDTSQTLTNKTISADSNTLSGIAASSFVLSNASGNIDGAAAQKAIPTGVVVGTTDTQTLTNKTLTDPTIIGTVIEDVYTITDGAAFEIDPANGSIQLITLGASRTPKATNFAAGESVTLMVDDGSAYTITWTDATFGGSGVIWETNGGVAPTLATSGYTTIVLWKVSTQVYGARVGNA